MGNRKRLIQDLTELALSDITSYIKVINEHLDEYEGDWEKYTEHLDKIRKFSDGIWINTKRLFTEMDYLS